MLIFIFIGQNSINRRVSVRSIARKASNDDMKHFVRTKSRYLHVVPRNQLLPRAMLLSESQLLFPSNPHTWLCDGKLLRLLDVDNPTNELMFRVCLIITIMCTHNMFDYYTSLAYLIITYSDVCCRNNGKEVNRFWSAA